MPELWVKICGMRSAADIEVAAAAGADALGFVFYEPSPRHLAIRAARALQEAVPAHVERVAVFLHPSQAEVDAVIDALHPDWVQTDLQDLDGLSLPPGQRVLPVLRKIGSEPVFRVPKNSFEPLIGGSRAMLDGGTSGAGVRADWAAARALASRCELVLAGGLDAGNVAEAIRTVRPFGVDVSSGVEHARGMKDPARVRDFINTARSADQALTVEGGR
jgi:phosphoribosylanthranilate isomerase